MQCQHGDAECDCMFLLNVMEDYDYNAKDYYGMYNCHYNNVLNGICDKDSLIKVRILYSMYPVSSSICLRCQAIESEGNPPLEVSIWAIF